MATQNKGFIKSFVADTVIAPFSIVKYNANANHCSQATAGTDPLIGVADELGAPAIGDNCDAVMSQIALVKLAGTVAGGDYIGPNGSGLGIKVTTGQTIGKAFEGGVAGDIIGVQLAIGSLPSA